jgi:hypothetical protein
MIHVNLNFFRIWELAIYYYGKYKLALIVQYSKPVSPGGGGLFHHLLHVLTHLICFCVSFHIILKFHSPIHEMVDLKEMILVMCHLDAILQ